VTHTENWYKTSGIAAVLKPYGVVLQTVKLVCGNGLEKWAKENLNPVSSS
jgi:hypothetical protein